MTGVCRSESAEEVTLPQLRRNRERLRPPGADTPATRNTGEVSATTEHLEPTERAKARQVLSELVLLDQAAYDAIAQTPTPTLDAGLRRLTRAADKSRLWLGTAAAIALVGGARGRRAALTGVASIGVASAVVNLGFKPIAHRARPDRSEAVHTGRHVAMPGSTSFPSGHSASAFAFAEGVSSVLPLLGIPLRLSAAGVAYSRVHTGVHYPGDVIIGSLIGATAGSLVSAVGAGLARRSGAPGPPPHDG